MNPTAMWIQNLRPLIAWARAQLGAIRFARSFRPVPARAIARGAALAALALAAGAASARADWGADTWAGGRLVDVQVRVDGDPSPLYWSPDHDDRRYFEAFAGRNYSLVLRNTTGRRIAVLLSVDGLNVVNGSISSLRNDEPMYVLDPYETATIRGWRTSLDEVRRFVFVDERRSYAQRTGQANSDMGWIRVLAFREQRPWIEPQTWRWNPDRPWRDDADGKRAAPPAPEAGLPEGRAQGDTRGSEPQASAPEARRQGAAPRSLSGAPDAMGYNQDDSRERQGFPGTGWGDRAADHVERVSFTPERIATDRIILRYEYASGLAALGIFPDRPSRLRERDGELGFAKPPRW